MTKNRLEDYHVHGHLIGKSTSGYGTLLLYGQHKKSWQVLLTTITA